MPYTVSTHTYVVSQALPQHLNHKPVYAIPYEPFDGIYVGNTDAMYLSVGISQWGTNDVSAKVMRFTGNQWSPQAEELPVHRLIDMSILIAKSLFDTNNGNVTFPGGTFYDQHNCIFLAQEPRTPQEQSAFGNFIAANGQLIKDRLNSLCDVLLDLRRRAKI